MCHNAKILVFGVSNAIRFKPVSSATETSSKIEISHVVSLDMVLSNKQITIKGADQTAGMCRLACVFVVRKLPKTGFLVVEAHMCCPLIIFCKQLGPRSA